MSRELLGEISILMRGIAKKISMDTEKTETICLGYGKNGELADSSEAGDDIVFLYPFPPLCLSSLYPIL